MEKLENAHVVTLHNTTYDWVTQCEYTIVNCYLVNKTSEFALMGTWRRKVPGLLEEVYCFKSTKTSVTRRVGTYAMYLTSCL